MKICYMMRNNTEYAKIPGKSYRKDGKVLKQGVLYLGKVIDKDANIFYSRERGIYSYNPDTGIFSDAPETYTSEVRTDMRVKQRSVLDFGDAFFIDQIIDKMNYRPVIDTIPYKNRDTLYAMISYYVLSTKANYNAEIWYRGSYVNVLYPKANLISQRISDFVCRLGDADIRHDYFMAHIDWLMKNVCDSQAVILDSTGLPNSIDYRLAAKSVHNGKVSRETRLLVPVQRDSGFPLMFSAMQGNIVDISTALKALSELQYFNMDTNMVLMDAGYPSKATISQLYNAKIDFVTRLPSHFKLYKDIISEHANTLKSQNNIVKYGDRVLYVKQIECEFEGNKAYAYLGCDLNRYTDEIHKLMKKITKGKAKIDNVQKTLDSAGIFIILSSIQYKTSDILPAYYARQAVEQYFDVSKGSAKLTPLRVHTENAVYGHLLLSMIASTICVFIQKKVDRVYDSTEALFMGLRNQKCTKYKTRITLEIPEALANEFYKKFGISLPLFYDLRGKSVRPVGELPTCGGGP